MPLSKGFDNGIENAVRPAYFGAYPPTLNEPLAFKKL